MQSIKKLQENVLALMDSFGQANNVPVLQVSPILKIRTNAPLTHDRLIHYYSHLGIRIIFNELATLPTYPYMISYEKVNHLVIFRDLLKQKIFTTDHNKHKKILLHSS